MALLCVIVMQDEKEKKTRSSMCLEDADNTCMSSVLYHSIVQYTVLPTICKGFPLVTKNLTTVSTDLLRNPSTSVGVD